MPRAIAFLAETIHATAHEGFTRRQIEVRTFPPASTTQTLRRELGAVDDDIPLLIGIRSKTSLVEELFESEPRLCAAGAFCIGTDRIDLAAARRHGIAVFNAPFSNTRSVAELVIAEVIMLSRQVYARCRAAHEGRWLKDARGAHEVRGKKLGIVGYGHIGSQLSVLAESLGLEVSYYDVASKLPLGKAKASTSLLALLGECDFVSLHVPDTEMTRGMFGAAEFAAMKVGSHLINASRGHVVDIEALRHALEQGRLAGAAIDVFPKEPADKTEAFESPLRGMDQVVLTPHIGGSTQEAQANIGREVSGVLSDYVVSGKTAGSVNLPALDLPTVPPSCRRLLNLHHNVPGVLSAVNRLVADSGFNIVGQHLGTKDDVGLLAIDLAVEPAKTTIGDLERAIASLDASIRTSLIGA